MSNLDPSTHGAAQSRPRFYWELSDEEFVELNVSGLGLVEESALAHDLDVGRRLLSVQVPYAHWQDVVEHPATITEAYQYSDAISAILAAAVDQGFDAEELCNEALRAEAFIRSLSTQACLNRQPPPV